MKIVRGRPPNFDEIAAKFPAANKKGIIFTYGDTVYVTGDKPLNEALKKHEAVHIEQQRKIGGPDIWWERYISDPDFRLEQELEAHRAEYRHYKDYGRETARRNLKVIAKRLASPLYGRAITKAKARELVSNS